MNAASGYCEVVWIMDRNRLVDAESYERRYGWDDKRPLVSGYYIAHWPAGTANPHFLHDGLVFWGPYHSRRAAEAALTAVRCEAAEHEPEVRARSAQTVSTKEPRDGFRPICGL